MSKTSIFVVRAESDGAPESMLAGLYPSKKLAVERIRSLIDEGFDIAWFDEVLVGPEGADCEFFNR